MKDIKTKTAKDIITPEKKSGILLNNVKFSKSWTFWETYSAKGKKIDYKDSNKLIFKWDDLDSIEQIKQQAQKELEEEILKDKKIKKRITQKEINRLAKLNDQKELIRQDNLRKKQERENNEKLKQQKLMIILIIWIKIMMIILIIMITIMMIILIIIIMIKKLMIILII